MARGKKGIDGVDKVVDLFPAGSAKMIDRVLRRAADRDAKAANRNVQKAMRSALGTSRRGNKLMASLGRELGKALKHRGDVGGNKPSLRQKAPDTGGRTFHFAHSVVSKGDAPGSPSAKPVTGNGKTGRAAAHMRYIEREIAVETLYAVGAEASRDKDGRARDDGSFDREPGRDAHETSAGPGQTYIENPRKLESGEQVLFSFGTIGDRFEDRVAFWEQLEQAEAHPSARVQHRLIVELPHEATPQARFDMVKDFCQRFADDGIPYWAALHAPGAKNDSRNFHAHIVYSERPAERIKDPATGELAWDFSVVKNWTDSSRHARTSRPYRQDKLRAYTNLGFIPTLRKEFQQVVNAILARDAVKDSSGTAVSYDARSYAAMGVDVVPIQSINRIVADKLKDGRQTVLDGDYTKRMLATELREAAGRRDKAVLDLVALDQVLQAAAMSGKPQNHNKALPRELRGPLMASVPRKVLAAAGRKILETRRAALHIDVMERASVASLNRIIDATAPKAVATAQSNRDPAKKAEAPSTEAAAMLHAAALEELAETRRSVAKARLSARYKVGAAVNAWQELINAPPPQTSPAMRKIMQTMIDEPFLVATTLAQAAPQRFATRTPPHPSQAASPATLARSAQSTAPRDGARRAPDPAAMKATTADVAKPSPAATAAKAPTASAHAPRPDPSIPAGAAAPGPDPAKPQAAKAPASKSFLSGIAQPFFGLDGGVFNAAVIEKWTGRPLPARLREASEAVGSIIASIKASSDDPDVRMANLAKVNDMMSQFALANSRRKKAEAEAERVEMKASETRAARDAARPKVDPAQMELPGLAVAQPPRAPAAGATKVGAAPMEQASATPSREADGATKPVAHPAPHVAGTPEVPASATAENRVAAPAAGEDVGRVPQAASATTATTAEATTAGVTQAPVAKEPDAASQTAPDRPATPPTAKSADVAREATAGGSSPPATTPPPETVAREEHPDDARRRKKRLADEKAAKQRRAVLAKKGKGRGR